MAKQIFMDADKDSSGELDDEELMQVMVELTKKLGQAITADLKMQLNEEVVDLILLCIDSLLVVQVRAAISRFDADNSGTINFMEFLRMITMKPWKNLFPSEVQNRLPKLVLQLSRASQAAEDFEISNMSSSAQEVVASARQLFAEADKDGSGGLGADEICSVVKTLYEQTGKPADEENMLRDCRMAVSNIAVITPHCPCSPCSECRVTCVNSTLIIGFRSLNSTLIVRMHLSSLSSSKCSSMSHGFSCFQNRCSQK